jgi:hypothetical protein
LEISVSILPEEYAKLNTEEPEHSLKKYFDYYKTDDIGEEKGQEKARCRICQTEVGRTGGTTSSMISHLKGKLHKKFYDLLYNAARQKLDLQQRSVSKSASSGCE